MFKRKLVYFSCLLTRRDGAAIVQCSMIVSTRARNLSATVAKYLPKNYSLLPTTEGRRYRAYVVYITEIVSTYAPLTTGEVLDYVNQGHLEFGG